MSDRPPSSGDAAPAFQLPAADRGPLFDLHAQLRNGPVVLAFFPFAFTSTCTAELCTFSARMDEFRSAGAYVVGISCDSVYALAEYAKQNAIRTRLLSDLNKKVAEAYGVLYDDYKGLGAAAKRSVFVVDRDGRIAWSWIEDDADIEPPYDDVHAAVVALATSSK